VAGGPDRDGAAEDGLLFVGKATLGVEHAQSGGDAFLVLG
jgi:hypothetical protein